MTDALLVLAGILPQSGTPYISMVLAGFVVGIFGHMAGSRWIVAAGVTLIVLGALLFPLAINFTEGTPAEVQKAR